MDVKKTTTIHEIFSYIKRKHVLLIFSAFSCASRKDVVYYQGIDG
jgi:hypothetical protein